ncbi:MAG: ABC transporter permease [Saprospiraceae bacterium]
MLKNYLKIAIRNFTRNKLYTGLNIAGLTFGLTCFILISLYIFNELTFDRHFTNSERIFRFIENQTKDGKKISIPGVSYKLGQESKTTIPEVEKLTSYFGGGRDNISNPENKNTFYESMWAADPDFLDVLDFKLIAGDRSSALKEPNSIVLTESLARKLFNESNVVNRSVKLDGIQSPLKVTAVLKDLPENSSINFNLLISQSSYAGEGYNEMIKGDWSSNDLLTFARLKKDSKLQEVESKLKNLVLQNRTLEPGMEVSYSLQPVKDIYFYSGEMPGPFRKGNLTYIYIFGVIALFLLLIACINYMNLTTARASNRFKEIGVRKASGALRGNLTIQFLSESVLVSMLALIISIGVVNLMLPSLNEFLGKKLEFGVSTDYRIWLAAFGITFLIGLVSGSYPAFLLSGFQPIALLKNLKINTGGVSLRRVLVVFQFSLSIVMIIATMVLYLQIKYVNTKALGFNQDQLVIIDINSGRVRRGAETIKNEFLKIPDVQSVSVSSRVPGEWKNIPTVKYKLEGDTREDQKAYLISADEQFVNTFELKLQGGRSFQNVNDSTSVILNQSAASLLNIKEAVNQWIEIPSIAFGGADYPLPQVFKARLIGIVQDFHFQSLREKIAPMVLTYQNRLHNIDYFSVRLKGSDPSKVLAQMQEVLAKIDANHLFEHHFLNDQLALFYTEDHKRETILIWLAVSVVFIACFGLFGLATFSIEQRVKEIGVRKVLGASVTGISYLLSKDFLQLVLMANGIAFPVAYYFMSKWLNEFAYRISMNWWIFAVAGILALSIALITISVQSIKAAIASPIKSLRSE